MKRGLAIVLIALASCLGCGKIKSMVSPIEPIEAWVAKGAGGIGEMEYYLYLKNLKATKNIEKGQLSLEFDIIVKDIDYSDGKALPNPFGKTPLERVVPSFQIGVKLGDVNGNILTEFITEKTHILLNNQPLQRQQHLSLSYEVAVRDLRDTKKLVIGWKAPFIDF